MPLDSHVHFFTRSLLSAKAGRLVALLRASSAAEGLIRGEESGRKGLNPNALMDIIDTGLKDTPEEVMLSLDDAYGPGWSFVPLMMDIEYALVNHENGDEGDGIGSMEPQKERQDHHRTSAVRGGNASDFSEDDSAWARGFSAYSGIFGSLFPARPEPEISAPFDAAAHTEGTDRSERWPHRRLMNRLEEAWRILFGDGLEWGARRLLAHESFETQRRELTELKAAFPDRVYPFLGIDPRRRHRDGVDLVEFVGDYVGPGRPFAGVKLYTSSGYSPTDPALFDSKGLYAHCSRYRIPITVHFSPSGFATPLQSIRIRGDVYDPLFGGPLSADICRFDVKMTPGTINAAVRERQMRLNHPRLWDKVLKRWPDLVINFAHAGGAPHASGWVENPEHSGWAAWALRQASEKRGVYVDLSGYAGAEADLSLLANRMKKRRPALKRKILYGSDYFLTSLKDPDVRFYLQSHKDAFGSWWRAISEKNSKRFLSGGR